jgi:regulatory protein
MIDEQPASSDEAVEPDCRRQALKYLARREYSLAELARKLRKKGFPGPVCDRVIDALAAQKLVSDRRFAEAYMHARVRKGFGPVRIRLALEDAGVDKAIIDDVMGAAEVEWTEQLRVQLHKKYGESRPVTYKEWVKRARYLNDRGFSSEMIQSVLEFSG